MVPLVNDICEHLDTSQYIVALATQYMYLPERYIVGLRKYYAKNKHAIKIVDHQCWLVSVKAAHCP